MQKKLRNTSSKPQLLDVVYVCILLAFLTFILFNQGPNSLAKSVSKFAASDESSEATEVDFEKDLEDLRDRELLFPLEGFTTQGIQDSFLEARGNHLHEAMDILAPRNTRVVAVESGRIARLWHSKYGGITIYQFDPTETYAYYYAHLESYADDLKEQQWVTKGQVIGYVGTSGNAPKGTPHLHFTIFKLTTDKHWWEGVAINPYDVYSSSEAD